MGHVAAAVLLGLVLNGCRFEARRVTIDAAAAVPGTGTLDEFTALGGCDTLAAVPVLGGRKGLDVLSLRRGGRFAFMSIISPHISASGVTRPDHLQHTPIAQVAQPGDPVCKMVGERRFTIERPDSIFEFVALPVKP